MGRFVANPLALIFLGVLRMGVFPFNSLADEVTRPSSFARIAEYVGGVESNCEERKSLASLRKQLSNEHTQAFERLTEAQKELGQVKMQQAVQSIQLQIVRLQQQAALFNERNSDPQNNSPANGTGAAFVAGSPIVTTSSTMNAMREILLMEGSARLSEASASTFQRVLNILSQIQKIEQQAVDLQNREAKLIERQLALSDLFATRSFIELNGVMRVLRKTNEDDVGSKLVLAITLMRLERFDEALSLLQAMSRNATTQPLSAALMGELYARSGEIQYSKAIFATVMKQAKDLSLVRAVHANALAIQGQFDKARSEWQFVLSRGEHEIAARRGLALVLISKPNPSNSELQSALEHATIAVGLSSDGDWSCCIALALALAANSEIEQAVIQAENAARFAVSNHHELCTQIAEDLRNGKRVQWKF